MSDLTLLKSLIVVHERGAVGEAARALGLSQSALSRRIQILEADVGGKLLERSGRGVALTEMGLMVVREGRELAERYARLKEDVQRHARLEAGTVRIGGGATAVNFLLPAWIAEFQKEHPGVRFEVREAGSREVGAAVQNELLELGIVTLPEHAPALVVRPLLLDRIVLVAGAQHPLATRRRVSTRALEGQAVVGFEAGSAIRQIVDDALRSARVRVNVVMELRSVGAILRMVETTGSLGFVSEMGATGARVIGVSGLRIERQLALVQKRDRPLSEAAASFARQVQGGSD